MVNKCPYRRRQSEVNILGHPVVICFQISIFEPLKTAKKYSKICYQKL